MLSQRIRDLGGLFNDLPYFICDREFSAIAAFLVGFVTVDYSLFEVNVDVTAYVKDHREKFGENIVIL